MRKALVFIVLVFLFPAVIGGTLSTYRDVVQSSVHELYADNLSDGRYELEADAYAGNDRRNRIYSAYITDYSPSDYSNFSFYLEEQSNTNHNFHLTTYWLQNGELSDIGSGDFERIKDFGQPPAGSTYSTNLSDRDEDNGRIAIVVEGTHYWYEDDYLRVIVSNISESNAKVKTLCDYRGPFNECVSNSSYSISGQQFNISSIFEAGRNAVFKAPESQASINVSNSTRISGLWKGSFFIDTERPQLVQGASFRPQEGRIVIGD